MPREAQLATGEILEFPDETPDAVMDAAVKRHIAGSTPPPMTYAQAADAANLSPEARKMADFSMFAAEPAQLAAVQPKPPPDRVGEHLTAANKAVYRTAGLGPDLIASTLRAVGGADSTLLRGTPFGPIIEGLKTLGVDQMPEPVGGSVDIQRRAEAAGVPTVEPVDRQGRFTTRLLEEVMSALFPAGAAVSMGAKAARVKPGGPAKDSFIYPYAPQPAAGGGLSYAQPAREVVNQATLGGAAGAGAGAANETFGPSPGADITGALVGSLFGSNAANMGKLAGSGVRDVIDPKRVGREEVGGRLVRSMVDKNVDPDTGRVISAGDTAFKMNLDDSRKLEADVPGLKLPTGEATMDPGLQSLEYQRRTAGPNTGAYRKQESSNRQAVNTALEETAPGAATDAAARKALEARRKEGVEAVSAPVEKRGVEVDEARRAAEAPMTRAEAGEVIRKEIAAALGEARKGERGAWQAIDPEGATGVDTRPLRERAKALIDEAPRLEDPADTPEVVKTIAGKKPEGDQSRAIDPDLAAEAEKSAGGAAALRDTESFDEMLALKSQITDRIREERAAAAPNANRLRKLSAMNDEIEASLERSGDTLEANAGAKERFDVARQKSRELNDAFTRGTVAEVTAADARGGKRVENSELAGKFFRSGASGVPEALDDFERAVGNRAEARKALRAYALDDAARAAIVDGQVDAKKLDAWINKHRDALDRYPDIRADLGNLSAAQKSLTRASKRKEMVEKGLNDPKRSTIAKYLDREVGRDSIEAILSSPNPRREMTQLVNTLKRDPEALEGAKRAFWDRMLEGTTKSPKEGIKSEAGALDAADVPIVSNAGFKSFMAKHGDAARILYADDPEHLKRLGRIAEAVSATQRTTNIKAPGTSGTAQSMPSLTLAGMISRGYALQRGVVGLPYVIAETGVRVAKRAYVKVKQEEIDRLLDQALLDPEVAKTLVMEWNANNQKVIQRRLKLHLGHELEVGAAEGAEPDEKPKEK